MAKPPEYFRATGIGYKYKSKPAALVLYANYHAMRLYMIKMNDYSIITSLNYGCQWQTYNACASLSNMYHANIVY